MRHSPLRIPIAGFAAALLLVLLAFAVPPLFDWQVWARSASSLPDRAIPPLHGMWEPKLLGPGTVPALLIGVLGGRWLWRRADELPFGVLLLAGYALCLGWALSLALVDGTDGLSRVLGSSGEYLRTAREVGGIGHLLDIYIDHIPLDSPDNWPTHVAGHPPLALLFFVGLVRLGLGGDLAAGVVVTVLACTTAPAVLVALRALGIEDVARRAAPFLVLTPAVVFMAVSADGLFGAVAAWALACLALACRAHGRRRLAWSVLAGLLFGAAVMMSYGLPLLGLLALAVLAAARSWKPLVPTALAALAVVVGFAVGGFAWWEAYPVLSRRYWDGIASIRPASYWMWGNLAALLISMGPVVAAGLAEVGARRRVLERPLVLLVGAAVASIVLADLSRMSKAEVERIWLPFMPWLTIACAALPPRLRGWALAGQVLTAVLVQQLLYTSW
ncbi:glycosyltransferase family 39 protein [Nocardioides fonticola]|uniref:Glycosyltransferase family 39 protein n=1 Tax=Nocardioides fonticola TaxID=450363 RepID=A0ABP7XLU6_9ACTN